MTSLWSRHQWPVWPVGCGQDDITMTSLWSCHQWPVSCGLECLTSLWQTLGNVQGAGLKNCPHKGIQCWLLVDKTLFVFCKKRNILTFTKGFFSLIFHLHQLDNYITMTSLWSCQQWPVACGLWPVACGRASSTTRSCLSTHKWSKQHHSTERV